VVFDPKHDQFFGLQGSNTRLVGWKSLQGPEASIGVKLKDFAVDLTLLHLSSRNSMVYGTLQSGELYLASADDENMHVQYLPPADLPADASHVGTVARVEKAADDVESVLGTKRKPQHVQEDDSVLIFQVYCTRQGFVLVRHHVVGLLRDVRNVSRKQVQNASIAVCVDPASVLTAASVLGLSEEADSIVLLYSTEQKGELNQMFTSISMKSGDLASPTILLPAEALQVGLVGGFAVAIATVDSIRLLDVVRGAHIYSLMSPSEEWLLVTDPTKNSICAIFTSEGKLCVALSSVDVGKVTRRLTLAAVLTSSTELNVARKTSNASVVVGTLTPNDASLGTALIKDALARGLDLLNSVCTRARDDLPLSASLMDAYEASVGMFDISTRPSIGRKESGENPQDPILSHNGLKRNGVHKQTTNDEAHNPTLNGKHEATTSYRAATLRSIPKAFVDAVVPMLTSLILLPVSLSLNGVQNDAKLILKRLVASAKVSARSLPGSTVFRVLRCFGTTENSPYSSVEFAFDLLRYCSDVSERQIAILLQFMLTLAAAKDIVAVMQFRSKKGNRNQVLIDRFAANTKDEATAAKVLLTGTTMLLESIVSYSDLNEALLRSSFLEYMGRAEVLIAIELLLKPNWPSFSSGEYSRVLAMLSSLSACLRGPLTTTESATESRVKRAIAIEVKRTEALVSMHELATRANELIASGDRIKSEASLLQKVAVQLAPYQIERLVF
jgi:hypothetical protein